MKSALPPVALEVIQSLKKVEVQTTILAISLTAVVRGFGVSLMSQHFCLHTTYIMLGSHRQYIWNKLSIGASYGLENTAILR